MHTQAVIHVASHEVDTYSDKDESIIATSASEESFFLSGCCMAQRVVVRAVALLSAKTK